MDSDGITNNILDGWKAISAYVGKSIKTIQRWETVAGFPVRRVPGRKSVYALQEEVDRWLLEQRDEFSGETSLPPEAGSSVSEATGHWLMRTRRVPPRVWWALIVLAVLAGCLAWVSDRSPEVGVGPLQVTIKRVSEVQSHLVVRNGRGKSVLTRNLPVDLKRIMMRTPGTRIYAVQDMNGDGLDDLVLLPMDKDASMLQIWTQHPEGRLTLAQEVRLDDAVTWDGTVFQIRRFTSFCLSDLDGDGALEAVVIGHHTALFPAVLKVVTLTGEPVLTMEHPGWFTGVQVRRIGADPVIFASGTNNFITTFSEPVILRLSMNWHNRNVRFSLMRPGRRMVSTVPAGIMLTYARLGSFPRTRGCSVWEAAYLRAVRWHSEASCILVEAGIYESARSARPLPDGAPRAHVRLFEFGEDLSLTHSEYNDVVVQTLSFDPREERYRKLLVPAYWNGRDCQKTVCRVPQSAAGE